MKSTAMIVCVASLLLASPAFASTRSSMQNGMASTGLEVIQLITNSLGGELSSSQNKDPEDKKAYVLIDYAVPPSKQTEFISAFEKTASKTKDEEGSVVYTLSRTIDENLTFYLYSEWTGMKAVGEHFNSTYLKEYLKTIAELNVVWKLHILEPVVY
ncbi:hypothetical protein WJX84_003803 [Apatococcus fuscideae]|uniref:ABM domain-containing protein n=1 Tax=Apatococcus fuscideae TaxID=2026836 RepID=A0AAW1TL44_9CHLO